MKENFKLWTMKLKKEDPKRLTKIKTDAQRRYRAKKKVEKKIKDNAEAKEQFKAGNLNYGVKMDVPKALSWQEWKLSNPQGEFWDYIDYKKSLKKPKIEKIEVQTQNNRDHKREVHNQIIMKMEDGELPDHVSTGFNFFHPEQEKTTLDLIQEKENRMKDKIAEYYDNKR